MSFKPHHPPTLGCCSFSCSDSKSTYPQNATCTHIFFPSTSQRHVLTCLQPQPWGTAYSLLCCSESCSTGYEYLIQAIWDIYYEIPCTSCHSWKQDKKKGTSFYPTGDHFAYRPVLSFSLLKKRNSLGLQTKKSSITAHTHTKTSTHANTHTKLKHLMKKSRFHRHIGSLHSGSKVFL